MTFYLSYAKMNSMPGHVRKLLKGPKFSGKHSTVIDTAIPVVEAARDCDHVTKVALGIIKPVRPSKPHIKFTATKGGLKVQVRGANAVQIFWLYTTEPDSVIEEITTKWDSN